MNLKKFLDEYSVSNDRGQAPIPENIRKVLDDEDLQILELLGGKVFNQGLYRVHRGDEIEERTEVMWRMFEGVRGKAIVFGADWLGRQFVLDFTELSGNKPTVTCLEPGVPDSFCTDQNLLKFHNRALVKDADAALAANLFEKWRKTSAGELGPDQCAGYKTPLFLGGEDELENLEISDMNLYMEMCAQLWDRVKDLPEGSEIGDIDIEESE